MVSWHIREECGVEDRRFVESLNPRLTEAIKAPTHSASQVQSFQEAFTATAWAVEPAKGRTFLALDANGQRIGYVSVREGPDDVLDEPCGYIALLVVKQEHEGKGVARSLLARAELWAKEMGFSRIGLDVFASNDHAIEFYERVGFKAETVRVIKRL